MFELNKQEKMGIGGGGEMGNCFCKVKTGSALSMDVEFTNWELGDSNHKMCKSLCCNVPISIGYKYEYNNVQYDIIPHPFTVVELPLVSEEWC